MNNLINRLLGRNTEGEAEKSSPRKRKGQWSMTITHNPMAKEGFRWCGQINDPGRELPEWVWGDSREDLLAQAQQYKAEMIAERSATAEVIDL